MVPTFVRHLRVSKISEATQMLRTLHQKTASYFETPHGSLGAMHCLPESAGPAPSMPSTELKHVDFYDAAMPGQATWKSLGFRPAHPIRYRYTLETMHAGCHVKGPPMKPLVTFKAEGDLDGDGQRSTFLRAAGTNPKGSLIPVGTLYMHRRTE
ncbi:MAG: hypothetical protein H6715_04050 [Myxococcales bacterium]|nr:hypothetical protein [Myxococcales bacterium]